MTAGPESGKHFVGILCKREHRWNGCELSLRYISGSHTCVECARQASQSKQKKEYMKAWRAANAEARKSYAKRYRAENLEDIKNKEKAKRAANLEDARLRDRLWYKQNAKKVNARCSKYKKENTERLRQYTKAYKKAHPELARHWEKTRRARKGRFRDIAPTLTEIKARNAEFGNCCAYCGSADPLQVDHFIPISKDGPHSLTNIVPACHTCNSGKRDRDAEDWYRSKSFFTEERWTHILETLYSSVVEACRPDFL